MRLHKGQKVLLLLLLWLAALCAVLLLASLPTSPSQRHIPLVMGAVGLALAAACLVVILIPNRAEWVTGRCRACEYDLTGNQSGRCPECGTPIGET